MQSEHATTGGDLARTPQVPNQKPYVAAHDSPLSWYVLGLLTFSYALAYIDRQLLNLLIDPIKHSLGVTDTQLSFIQGTAFISAYLVAAPLFGRLADITNRRNILLLGVCLWSIFTALCGRADTYTELFLARFGVGASEACVLPVCWSLLSDYFSERRAPRALSIFMLGPLLGGGFSLVAGGLVIAFANNVREAVPAFGHLATWQLAFVLVGIPGALLAAALLTVREPQRTSSAKSAAQADRKYTLRETGAYLWNFRAFYGRVYWGVGMIAVVVLGMPAWLPAYLIRYHGVAPASVGYRIGVTVVLCGTAGVLAGPWFARLLERRGYQDTTLRVAAWSLVALFGATLAVVLAPNAELAMAATGLAVFTFSMPTGILAAVTQFATPPRLRGIVASLYSFFAQLIGYGIGPTAIALVTDKGFGDPKMVGYSIGIVCCIASAVAAWMMFSALPHYKRMLSRESQA